MWSFDDIGAALGDGLRSMAASAFESAMTAIWDASLTLLHIAFGLADQFSVFSVSTTEGPLKVVWPLMVWISGVLAMGLFSWQLIVTNLRGGRGFMRLVTGPVQYGIALAVTVGMVATFLAAADGLTEGILSYGLASRNFTDALSHTSFAGAAGNGVKAVVLGICAFVGVIPAALGFVLEMLFRMAAIEVLVAVVPLVAAGALAQVSSPWFWRTSRGLLVTIVMKPVLALTLVIAVAAEGGTQGLAGLVAGIGVLVISLLAPFAVFRLFAFIDPHSDAGGAFRDFMAGVGVNSYGPHSVGMELAGFVGNGAAMEEANTGRFDRSIDDDAGEPMDHSGGGWWGDERGSGDSEGRGGDWEGDGPGFPPPDPDRFSFSGSGDDPAGADGDDPPPLESPEGGGG